MPNNSACDSDYYKALKTTKQKLAKLTIKFNIIILIIFMSDD
jgi:hypothetical protein